MGIQRLLLIILLLCGISTAAKAYDSVAFHCDQDTTAINSMLADPALKDMEPAARVGFFARRLVGSPSSLRQDVLEADSIEFTVNIHTYTPLSFIATCVALAQAYETSSAPNWRDFADRYEAVMYKRGEASDYVSRFLYPSDWIADNIFRGNVVDATGSLDGVSAKKKAKSLDYISHHRDDFKALANDQNFERLKMLEMGFRNHMIPYITNGDLTSPGKFKPQAKEGDIFFLLAPDFNLDSREMGILLKEGDKLLIVQQSPAKDAVTIEELPFENYVKRNIKRIQGARIIRIAK